MKKAKKIRKRGRYTFPWAAVPGSTPEVGKTYHAFWKNKINEDYLVDVVVTEVLSVNKFREKYPEDYKDLKEHFEDDTYHFHGRNSINNYLNDYVVIAKVNDPITDMFGQVWDEDIFIREPYFGIWISCGDMRLDVSGKLYERVQKEMDMDPETYKKLVNELAELASGKSKKEKKNE